MSWTLFRRDLEGLRDRCALSYRPLAEPLEDRAMLSLSWVTTGEASVVGDTVELGVADRQEGDSQPAEVHSAYTLLPRASAYTITFDYDLSSWDSYTAGSGQGQGYWDSFSFSVTPAPYDQTAHTDPLTFPGLGFLWGGSEWGDGILDNNVGSQQISFTGDPNADNYLNIVLDTFTPDAADGIFPSWGNVSITIQPTATVVGRHVFYNNSGYDGNDAGINSADDTAIATDKSAYLPGNGTATSDSVTSYSRGINGVMVDIADLPGSISLNDFQFKMSDTQFNVNNIPSTWTAAPTPTAFSVRPGAGLGGTDRVEIVWADGAMQDRWLEVTVEGNDAAGGFNSMTGLLDSDIFYFGNKIGDTFSGGLLGVFNVDSTDEVETRDNQGINIDITNLWDFNRDFSIDATDQIITRSNQGIMWAIDIGSPPAPPPAAPSGAVAVALTLQPVDPQPVLSVPGWPNSQAAVLTTAATATPRRFDLVAQSLPARSGAQLHDRDWLDEESDVDDELLKELSVELLRA